MSKKLNENEQLITLTAKQIKNKLEDAFAYDHKKYRDCQILFDKKAYEYSKLPFSDFKVAISEELENQKILLENLDKYVTETKLIEEKDEDEVLEETNDINVIEEICEFDEIDEEDDEFEDEDDELALLPEDSLSEKPTDDMAKKPKISYTTIKIVDVEAVVAKIKKEGMEKNLGKPILGRRQINKMLKPYMLKKANSMDIDGIDDSLTSIDIYLNAVNKIANTNDNPLNDTTNPSLELNINEILEDLEK